MQEHIPPLQNSCMISGNNTRPLKAEAYKTSHVVLHLIQMRASWIKFYKFLFKMSEVLHFLLSKEAQFAVPCMDVIYSICTSIRDMLFRLWRPTEFNCKSMQQQNQGEYIPVSLDSAVNLAELKFTQAGSLKSHILRQPQSMNALDLCPLTTSVSSRF